MPDTRGIFRLSEVVTQRKDGYWISAENVWNSPSKTLSTTETPVPFAYFTGGTYKDSNATAVYKVAYSNDTVSAVPSAQLTKPRYAAGGSGGNLTSGYIAGGNDVQTFSKLSTIDKLTYSSETIGVIPSTLSISRDNIGGVGNSTNAYFAGGSSPSNVSTVNKVTYSSDTVSSLPSGPLTAVKYGVASTGNTTAGYFGGGVPGGSAMDKLTYASDTTAALPAALLVGANGQGLGNSATGYFVSGQIYGTGTSSTSKMSYSTDTITSSIGCLARYNGAGTGNSTLGYLGGGNPFNGTAGTQMEKLTYSTDTFANISAYLNPAGTHTFGNSAISGAANGAVTSTTTTAPAVQGEPMRLSDSATESGSSTAAYYAGGQAGVSGSFTTTDKTTYSNDTTSVVPSAALISSRYSLSGNSSPAAGYFGTGDSPATSVDKLAYSTETVSLVPAVSFNPTVKDYGATGNYTAGYFGGGTAGGLIVSTLHKLTYSTETKSIISPLPQERRQLSATTSISAGYFAGGFTAPSSTSQVNKLTYTSETTASVPSGPLSVARNSTSAASSPSAAYIMGGIGPSYRSDVDKLTFSTDTSAASPARLTSNKISAAATRSGTAGYIGGGRILTGPGYITTIDKLTFATDTISASPGALSGGGRSNLAAVRNSTYTSTLTPTPQTALGLVGGSLPNVGYFVGGNTSTTSLSSSNKITFSTDTVALIPSTLAGSRYSHAASSSPAATYIFGGTFGDFTTIEKITYSNDTASLTSVGRPSGTFTLFSTSVGSTTQGYFAEGIGDGSQITSTVYKLTYSGETFSTIPAKLSTSRYATPTACNNTQGYFLAGQGGSTSADKLTYSSDTISASPSTRLDNIIYAFGHGTSSSGYISGGDYYGPQTATYKVTYSTDGIALVPSANLNEGRRQYASTGNSTSGYVAGGDFYGFKSSIEKMTYSSETYSLSPATHSELVKHFTGSSASANGAVAPQSYGSTSVAV